MWQTDLFVRRGTALFRFFDGGDDLQEIPEDESPQLRSYPADYDPGMAEMRVNMCVELAEHMGLQSMRMLLPGGLLAARRLLQQIKESVASIPDAEIRSRQGKDWKGWNGLAGECHAGIATNSMSEEEIAAQDLEE